MLIENKLYPECRDAIDAWMPGYTRLNVLSEIERLDSIEELLNNIRVNF